MDSSQKGNKQNQMEIELSEQEATGTYSNLVLISHSASEFILDFLTVMPGLTKAKVVKRMILSPDHAKRLTKALHDNIQKYESENGTIQVQKSPEKPFNYRGPMPEA